MIRRLWPETIRGQMMAIILGAVVFVSVTGDFTENALKRHRDGVEDIEDYALSVSAVSHMLATRPPADRPARIAEWQAAGIGIALVPQADLAAIAGPAPRWFPGLFHEMPDSLPAGFDIIEIRGKLALSFPLDDGQALLFADIPQYLLDTESVYFLSAILALVVGFSTLAVRSIIAPARRMADALRDTDRFLAGDEPIRAEGARELRTLAHALNELRARIRRLLDTRDAMLRGVSHDLRTPLTRLRLRVDRIENADLRTLAQNDIAQIDAIIDTTLDYLRNGSAQLVFERCDLGSILTTICDDFADTGGRIAYFGPDHIVMDASVTELTRAVSNLCDNGLKFGTTVRVDAEILGPDVLIHVIDDGPGIPAAMREKVLQPFVKLDAARAGGGFGLGLSIATEIVARHGGDLHLLDHRHGGLHVQLRLPRHPRAH